MYIHFAFGSDKHNLHIQADKFISNILEPKRLLVSKCEEFIPVLPIIGSQRVNLNDQSAKLYKDDKYCEVRIKIPMNYHRAKLATVSGSDILYIPETVPMVCFIKIQLSKLKCSPHSSEYGKLGIAFTNDFIKKLGVKPVQYYDEQSVYRDPLIKKWNCMLHMESGSHNDIKEKARLVKEITAYRKPRYLWENFSKNHATVMKISSESDSIFFWKYDRYPLGYEFFKELEHRVAFDGEDHPEYIYFNDQDILKIIAPNDEINMKIKNSLERNFMFRPEVITFPY